MAVTKQLTKITTRGEWICRDAKSWRVKVPTANGHQIFKDDEYGGSGKALLAARNFHEKMYNQLKRDRAQFHKTGSKVEHETMYMTNRSGHRGIAMVVTPRLEGPPRIEYIATWSANGQNYHKYFSTVTHGDKTSALNAAIEHRKRMTKRYR